MRTPRALGVILVALLLGSCAARDGSISEAESREVVDSVTAGMRSYAAALESQRTDRIMAHYLEGPDFRLTQDGTVYTRDQMRGVLDASAQALDRLEVKWDSIVVTPLASEVGLAVAPFRLSLVAKDSTVDRKRGVATWVWVRRNGEWRMLYGHGDHYPDTTGGR